MITLKTGERATTISQEQTRAEVQSIHKYNQIMLDIETIDDSSTSAILSIGAVKFNIETGQMAEVFHEYIELQSCIDAGLTVSGNTVYWWLGKSEEARKRIIDAKKISIQEALVNFSKYCDKDSYIWAYSPRFDISILSNAYLKATTPSTPIPWDRRKEMDARTLANLLPGTKDCIAHQATLHDAVDDCVYQIKFVHEIYKELGLNNNWQFNQTTNK